MSAREAVKFLIVDDLAENLRALEALLRRDDLEIHQARSGTEALELLLRHDFSLAMLDVQMPDMDGYELAEMMRSTERTRNVPIIFITAMTTNEGRRFRGYEAGAVDYVFKPVDPLILRTKANVFFELGLQRQELAQQRNELKATTALLSDALGRLQAHADNSPLAIVEFGPDLKLLSWSKGAERLFGWTAAEAVGKYLKDLAWLPSGEADILAGRLLDALAVNGQGGTVEAVSMLHKSGMAIECEWFGSVLRDATRRPVSLNVQILDTTERRQAADTQRLLIGELNHRVKNTLASVQAIANQTLRHTTSPQHFAETFSGRIQSLARAHAMLSAKTWQGAQLMDLVRDQLRLGTIDAQRLSVDGGDVELAPTTALRLALIVHELSTNAAKYGALSNVTGTISISWTVVSDQLTLIWKEEGGPLHDAPKKHGFGTMLIEQSVRPDRGTASAFYMPGGVEWTITMKLSKPDPAMGKVAFDLASVASGKDQQAHRHAEENDIRNKTYLVVEDEALVGMELISILEDAGARTLGPAGTIKDALELVETAQFDAAFLDGNLNGHSVDDIAASLNRRNIPFFFVSGYGREHLPSDVHAVGCVSKPFSPDDLLDAAAQLAASPGKSGKLHMN